MILGWILNYYWNIWMFPGFPGGSDCKESACNAGDLGLIPGSLGKKDPLEKGMATHSSLLACRIPWTEEPCGLWSVGSQRVGHNWVTNIWLFPGFPSGSADKESACSVGDLGLIPALGRSPGEQHSNPLHYSCLENPHGQRRLVGCSPYVTKIWTWLSD